MKFATQKEFRRASFWAPLYKVSWRRKKRKKFNRTSSHPLFRRRRLIYTQGGISREGHVGSVCRAISLGSVLDLAWQFDCRRRKKKEKKRKKKSVHQLLPDFHTALLIFVSFFSSLKKKKF